MIRQAKIAVFVPPDDTECQHSSVVEQLICNQPVGGSNPSVGSASWIKSKFANLYRYAPSGKYYIRAKVNGRLIRRCLKTKSLEIAKAKLDELITMERSRPQNRLTEDCNMGHYADVFLAKVAAKAKKPRSLGYRQETWEQVKRTWKGIGSLNPRRITKKDCEEWAARAKAHYSATRFNGALETLRNVFKAAIKDGAIVTDPTEDITRASVKTEQPAIPSDEQFKAILSHLDTGDTRRRPAALAVRLMAFTGMRLNEARKMEMAHVDLKSGWISLPGSITKNGRPRRIPIIPALRPLLKQWQEHLRLGLRLVDPRRALRSAAKTVGLDLTPHDMRHLFTTVCIESNVDIRTIAGWRGDKDNGAMLLRIYSHLRDSHSQAMARRVRF